MIKISVVTAPPYSPPPIPLFPPWIVPLFVFIVFVVLLVLWMIRNKLKAEKHTRERRLHEVIDVSVRKKGRELVRFSFRSMLLIDVFSITFSLLTGLLLLALSSFFLQIFAISAIFSLHALFSITLYIHKEVNESIQSLNNLMLVCLVSTAVNLVSTVVALLT